MKIALFGGTFDPVHRGHLAVAQAAVKKFKLDLIYFAPADIPPHKQKRELTDFRHRFAMLALATASDKRFVPSLIDAPTGRPNYSVDTVRRLKAQLGKSDQLFFLIGMDAFKDIPTWRKPIELLSLCDFIVVTRPGFSLEDMKKRWSEAFRARRGLWRDLGPRTEEGMRGPRTGRFSRAGVMTGVRAAVHLIDEVHEDISSTQIRAAARKSVAQLSRLVPQTVAEYIKKQGLYLEAAARAKTSKTR
jgi:nicotinate-nucleotide adenylyltransferase